MTGVYLAFVFVAVLFVLVIVPRIVFPLGEVPGTFLDRTVAGAVGITAVTLAAMYVFAAIGLLETFALIAVWVATWWVAKGRHRERGRVRRSVQNLFKWSDMTEANGVGGATHELTGGTASRMGWRVRKAIHSWRQRYPGHASMLISLGVLAVLAYASYMRFQRPLTHLELVPQDSYLALFTTKAVNHGQAMAEGIYPQGVLFWWSMIDRFYVFDTHHFIRFVGPTMAVIELIALYWVTSRASRSRAAGLLSMSVFAIYAGNPGLFVDWSRQVGAMVQELAIAFAIVSLVFGAEYMAKRRTQDLILAGAAMFVGATSHTAAVVPLAIGYTVILAVGLVSRGWTATTFRRMVVVGLVAAAAAHAYFPIGLIKGNRLALVYELYNPTSGGTFTSVGAPAMEVSVGDAITGNMIFQLGLAGALIAVLAGLLLALSKHEHGRTLLASGGTVAAVLLAFDFIFVRYGILFRVRMSWVSAVFMVIGIGLGVGALAALLAAIGRVKDLLHGRLTDARRFVRTGLELAAAAIAVIVVAALWPSHHAVARDLFPSGYPQATGVALDLIDSEELLTYTVVGTSEQFQEITYHGWFVEAWVFARDIAFTEARDPSYEIPIPTDRIYIFAEKEVFRGPESRPFGPTEEYYRNTVKRERIERRITLWMEEYRRFHDDVEVYYEDAQVRVYKVERAVDLSRASLTPAFKDYTWLPGELFDDDGDITTNRVVPNPEANLFRQDAS